MNVTVTAIEDASHRLARFRNSLDDKKDFDADLGRRLANDLREHFRLRQLNGPRNQFGAPSSGFWSDIRDSVNDGELVNDGVVVTISDPRFVQKFYGGTIKGDGKLLAIPARAEAYGRSPRNFPFLKAVFFRSGAIALVETERTKLRRTKTGFKGSAVQTAGMVWYWLKEEVHQDRDPNALPATTALMAGLLDTAEKHINRKINEAHS
ncbi:MAG TPA: hypothetical protein VF773_10840 [Verrucomicrobiae bacterium]